MERMRLSAALEIVADDFLLLAKGTATVAHSLCECNLAVSKNLGNPELPEEIEWAAYAIAEDLVEAEEYLDIAKEAFKTRARMLYEISARISSDWSDEDESLVLKK